MLQQNDCIEDIDFEIFKNNSHFAEMKLFKRKLKRFEKRYCFQDVLLKETIEEHFVLDLNLKKAFKRSSLSAYSGYFFLLFQEVLMNSGDRLSVGLAYNLEIETCSLIAYGQGWNEKRILEIPEEFFHPFLCFEKDFVHLMQKLFRFKFEEELQKRLFECGAVSSKGISGNFSKLKVGLKEQLRRMKAVFKERYVVSFVAGSGKKKILIEDPNSSFFVCCYVRHERESVSLKILKDENVIDFVAMVLEKSLPKITAKPLNTTSLFKKTMKARFNQEF